MEPKQELKGWLRWAQCSWIVVNFFLMLLVWPWREDNIWSCPNGCTCGERAGLCSKSSPVCGSVTLCVVHLQAGSCSAGLPVTSDTNPTVFSEPPMAQTLLFIGHIRVVPILSVNRSVHHLHPPGDVMLPYHHSSPCSVLQILCLHDYVHKLWTIG